MMDETSLPIDEVELGLAGFNFDKITDLRRKDAKAQEALIDVIACCLENTCLLNDAKQKPGFPPSSVTVFHGQRPPNITPRQYIERIATYSGCSPCCLVMGMKYLETLKHKDPAYELTSLNFHRLVLTAVLIASKFVDDFYYSNGYWAKVGGVQVDELNGMETEFLFLISFNLHVKRAEYDAYVAELFIRMEDPLRGRMGNLNIGASPTSAVLWDGFTGTNSGGSFNNHVQSAGYPNQQAGNRGLKWGAESKVQHRPADPGLNRIGAGPGMMVPIHHPQSAGMHHGAAPVAVPASRGVPPVMGAGSTRGLTPMMNAPPPGSAQPQRMGPPMMGGPLQQPPRMVTMPMPLEKMPMAPPPAHSSYTGLALEC